MNRILASILVSSLVLVAGLTRLTQAEDFSPEQLNFFEQKIRPLLIESCFECHSTEKEEQKGGLYLDSREAILKGGDNGPAVVVGDPDASLLAQAVHYSGGDLEMPPEGKLRDDQIALLEEWIRLGLPMPETKGTVGKARVIDIAEGKKHWSFQPLRPATLSNEVASNSWQANRIDHFILAELNRHGIKPAAPASKRELLRRAKFDLVGLPPTFEEVQEFEADTRPDAFERRVEAWMATPEFGERWARAWLELVRYADTIEDWADVHDTYRYRDWVVEAMNEDLPFDRFSKLQIAADQMNDARTSDIAALGYLGMSPTYWKELQLPVEIIKSIVSDEYEERIHTWSSTFLGLNMACARCHDHKVDPITQKDYYAIAGVFSNSRLVDRSLEAGVDSIAVIEARKLVKEQTPQLEKLNKEVADLAAKANDPAATDPAATEAQKQQLLAKETERNTLQERIEKAKATPGYASAMVAGAMDSTLEVQPAVGTHGSRIVYQPTPKDAALEIRGNPNRLGEIVKRRYVSVLTPSETREFNQGSGRIELAEAMFNDSQALVARVIVNRIWRLHMGKGIVETPSDFGMLGEPPSHPELLDDLAYRFVQSGWSLKWLHREIVCSATYQQSSKPSSENSAAKQLFHFYPVRRLDVEGWRDAMLQTVGNLDLTKGGPPLDLAQEQNYRRTIYGLVKRRELTDILRLHDFPDPVTHSPGRYQTNTPLQQLFVLNSPFMLSQATAFVRKLEQECGNDKKGRIELAYRLAFARTATVEEIAAGEEFLSDGSEASWVAYAQVLLGSNEFFFLD